MTKVKRKAPVNLSEPSGRDVHLMLSQRAGRTLHAVLGRALKNGACSQSDKAVITAIQRDLKDHF